MLIRLPTFPFSLNLDPIKCIKGVVIDPSNQLSIEEGEGVGLKPVKKRTSVVTNSVTLATELKRRQCKGDHVHANTFGGRIKQCEIYPEEFCELICRTVSSETVERGERRTKNLLWTLLGIQVPHDSTRKDSKVHSVPSVPSFFKRRDK